MEVQQAMKRNKLSAPTKYLLDAYGSNGMSIGEPILDFGCGHGFDCDHLKHIGYNIDGYDKHFRPNGIKSKKYYYVVICNYVLNCISLGEQKKVLREIHDTLISDGLAYITIRKDVRKPVTLNARVMKETSWYRMYVLTKEELGKILQ